MNVLNLLTKMFKLNKRNNSNLEMSEIVSIEYIGNHKTVDICVEDVHMFFANDIYTHNSGAEKDVIDNTGISNAFSKVFIATVVMTLSRKIKDKMNNTARLHLSKSRLGPDGITFPMKFDTYAPFFEVYDPKSSEGSKVKTETLTDEEYERKVAAQAYMDQQKRKNNLF